MHADVIANRNSLHFVEIDLQKLDLADETGNFLTILITASGEADENDFVIGHFRRDSGYVREGMRRFQRRQDSFQFGKLLECVERLLICY